MSIDYEGRRRLRDLAARVTELERRQKMRDEASTDVCTCPGPPWACEPGCECFHHLDKVDREINERVTEGRVLR